MYTWFARNLALVNLVLVVFCIVSYLITINWLVFWTNWEAPAGGIGGVLDYNWFGQSFIYHVSKESLRAEQLFSFLDYTSYLLAAITIINLAALVSRDRNITASSGIQIRRLAFMNLIMAILCMVVYAWGTMMFIDNKLKHQPLIGGVVDYGFFFYVAITHVYEGRFESSLNWRTFGDWIMWVLLVMLVLNVIMVSKQLSWEKPGRSKENRQTATND